MRFASSANHSRKEAAYAISPRDSAKGLPCSVVMSTARSSWFSIINENQLRITWARCLPVCARQPAQASSAASTARRVSSRESAGTDPMTSPVAGFVISVVPPRLASTHSPPT
jgi:hypothetical protein